VSEERIVDHEQASALFSPYLDGDLATDDRRSLEEHLASCPRCARDYEAFQELVGSMHHLHKMAAPQLFADGVKERIRARSGGRFFRRKTLWERLPVQLFTGLMLLLLVALYAFMHFARPALLLWK
jgi:anti-sigma factor RsiW